MNYGKISRWITWLWAYFGSGGENLLFSFRCCSLIRVRFRDKVKRHRWPEFNVTACKYEKLSEFAQYGQIASYHLSFRVLNQSWMKVIRLKKFNNCASWGWHRGGCRSWFSCTGPLVITCNTNDASADAANIIDYGQDRLMHEWLCLGQDEAVVWVFWVD